MTRAIADSDDDGSDDDSFGPTTTTNADTPVDALAAPSTKRTGSTEQLRRDIDSIERTLWANSAPGDAGPQATMTTATRAGEKRRHTATLASEATPTPPNGVKRAKTSKASSPSGPATDGSYVTASQEPIFTDHSETNYAALLPRDSLQEDFRNHEPSVMFPHSGSTEVDDSSAQRQMMDALNENNHPLLSTGVLNALPSNGLQNSSLPWSAFESNGRSGSSGGGEEPAADAGIGAVAGEQPVVVEKVFDEAIDVTAQVHRGSHNAQSPVVEIRQSERRSSVSTRTSRAESPTGSKCNRNAQEEQYSSELLNSDDRAIGLPKERYKPRPTRRRATAIVEEPVDFSVRPEKATKIKRTKTTDATASKPDEDISITAKIIAALGGPGWKAIDAPGIVPEGNNLVVNDRSSVNEHRDFETSTEKPNEDATDKSTTQTDTNKEQPVATKDDATFSTPDLPPPPPKKKYSAKAKRAQTTIFEDHVKFVSSQRSPNLSQQQGSRMAALKPVKAGAQKQRKTVVSDDEDEDASIKDVAEEAEEAPPKKRGRGRPPKAMAKPVQKSAEEVLEHSESEGEGEAEVLQDLKKGCKDQQSKSITEPPSKDAEKENAAYPSLPDPSTKTYIDAPIENGKGMQPAEPTSTPDRTPTATDIPTPSPEKENAAPPQPNPPKGSPTSHSPIKGSSKVPLRVGLSKRQRIPSLLRVMRPPKKQ